MIALNIPQPCKENWDNMTAEGNGRHCISCAKTVVDFTQLSDQAVQQYFLLNGVGGTCGRFKKSQLASITFDIPVSILQEPIALWKKFLAAALIAFGSFLVGCNTTNNNALGGAVLEITSPKKNQIFSDSIPLKANKPSLAFPKTGSIVPPTVTVSPVSDPVNHVIMGAPAIRPAVFQEPEIMGEPIVDTVPKKVNKDSISCSQQSYQ